ncbi:prolipoprotein diacylglyceryl transferase [Candidatus Woesearchaeota archaeon]|nr:prolipoprotein diacylglyceryl transferase [Candidatus Woesearchaeota archaeon]
MWIHNLNPVIADLGFAQIRWYGLVYVLGFFFSWWWLHYLSKKGKLKLTSEQIWDFLFYLLLGVLIGSRLFEVFWEPSLYLNNPLNFFKFWRGGMSFHGGLVGIVVAGYWYCKKRNLNFLEMADALSLPTMFALALGRIANFINGELVGTLWNGTWCVVFPQHDQACRHPSTLYAAGYRILITFWLLFLSVKEKFGPGFIFWNFIFWEGVGRFIVDFFREETIYWSLTIGQWFSIVMIIIAIALLRKNTGTCAVSFSRR